MVPTVRPSANTSIFAPARCGVDPLARTTVTSAAGSPRFSIEAGSPFRLGVAGEQICLYGASGSVLACAGDPGQRPAVTRVIDATTRDELTPQELQVALQVARGLSNREIAQTLFLSPKTVEFHLTRIYRKLDLHARAELVERFGGQVERP